LSTETQKVSREDPRLERDALGEWKRTDRLVDGDDPSNCDFFRNKETDELINYDPRLERECLERIGVELDWFSLVRVADVL
jgi:hypothetical protein